MGVDLTIILLPDRVFFPVSIVVDSGTAVAVATARGTFKMIFPRLLFIGLPIFGSTASDNDGFLLRTERNEVHRLLREFHSNSNVGRGVLFCFEIKNKMAIKIPLYLFSHHRKIANVYKKYLRLLEAQHFYRDKYRYEATLVRAEFDTIFRENDMRKSKQMLLEKEEELYKLKKFPLSPVHFPSSPEGVDYQRDILFEDWHLDYWHPLEKAMYPEYFAKRELRKQQYLEMWERLHGPPKPNDH